MKRKSGVILKKTTRRRVDPASGECYVVMSKDLQVSMEIRKYEINV